MIVTRDEQGTASPKDRAGLKALPADVDLAYVTSCDVPLLGRLRPADADFAAE